MKKIYLFVIDTPLQYMVACEFIMQDKFQNIGEKHLLILSFFEPNIKQISNMLHMIYWDSVEFIFDDNKVLSNQLPTIIDIYYKKFLVLKYISNITSNLTLFIGQYSKLWQTFVYNKLSNKIDNVFIGDDGFHTVTVFSRFENKEKLIREKSWKNKIVRYLITSNKEINISNVTFFSMFKSGKLKIIPNKFEELKLLKNNKLRYSGDIFIIGQPFVKLGITSEDEYYKSLKTISNILGDKNIYYLKHKTEINIKLPNYWKIIKSEEILEFKLLNLSKLPSLIIGFYSTALITLSLLFKDNLKVMYINPDFLKFSKTDYSIFYSVLDDFGIENILKKYYNK